MNLIDLSCTIDATQWEPEPIEHAVLSHTAGAQHMSDEMKAHFDIDFDPAVLPDGELLSIDTLTLTTHTGTHVDAPAHYGSKASYGTPKFVTDLPLDWFYRPGVVADITAAGRGAVGAAYLRGEFVRIKHTPEPLDIVLLNTGSARYAGTPRYFMDFAGLDKSAVHFLLDLGVRVIGTDAFSLDAPFTDMIERYERTRDPDVLWPAHFAGRNREYCQIERLANLDALPRPYGFTVSCAPAKIANAGAGWTRAFAIVD
jgi:cyclase